jgi:RNA polymerase sigma factor (sigma-70 family)
LESPPDPVNLTSFHVRKAVQGDKGSLEWIVAHLDPFVEVQIRMRLKRGGGDPEDAKDLLSEVWIVALGKMSGLEPRDGRYAPVLMRFLATTAEFKCMEHVRKRNRRKGLEMEAPQLPEESGLPSMDGFPADTVGAVTRIYKNEVRQILGEAIEQLSEDKSQILVMRLLGGLSNSEIAEELSEKPNTISVRYRRALEELARVLPRSIFEGVKSLRDASRDEDSD